MAYTGNDGDGKFGNGPAQFIIVKDEEVCLCPSAPDDEQGIVGFTRLEYLYNFGEELPGIGFALNKGKIIIHLKTVTKGIVVKRMLKILVTCRGG
ncbi:hypothetical protein D3C87_1803500 [compost metagenome]